MKLISTVMLSMASLLAYAEDVTVLSNEQVKQRVIEITQLTNTMMREGSNTNDVDNWFANFTDDFVYIHQGYGGTYSREQLYRNSISNVENDRYNLTSDRYEIVQILAGYNGAAVQRKNLKNGKLHLTVFEFRGDKVAKTIEYWK